MKAGLRIPKPVVALCSAFMATSAFGQTTYVWTNQYPAHLSAGDLNQATNWSPNGVPTSSSGPDANGVYGDEMQFDGLTTGPLSVTENNTGIELPPEGQAGLRIHVTSNQFEPVTIYSPVQAPGPMRMNYFAIDAGNGSLVLGNHDTNRLDIIAGALNGQVLGFTNDSATPCMINESVRWRLGGAGSHPFVFAGSGDWILNNHMRSANNAAIILQKFGPGTVIWTGTNNAIANYPDQLGSPITIGGGTMIWKTSDLVGGSAGAPNIVHNGVLFEYDAPAGVCTNAGVVSGTGPIQMNAGILLLSGQNTISGNWTLSGGTLIAGSVETTGVSGPLGLGGTISFTGGTLTYSANNAFDYSARFSTAAGQTISIDTAGQTVRYATALASSGGTLAKAGGGQLTLINTSSYSGLTTINGGTLTFQGPKTGSGGITVADGATLGVFNAGTQVMPGTLILGTSAGANFEFDNVTSTTTAPLAPGTIVSAGTTLIRINSGTFSVGQSYPLLTWTSGSPPSVSLGAVNNAGGNLSTNGNAILFIVASVAPVWTGVSSGNWSDPGNWTTPYADPQPVLFDDTAPGTTSVIVDTPVHPASVTVNNNTKSYSLASSGGNNVAGSTGLTKSGSGTLTLSGGANTYTGVTRLGGGVLSVGVLANGGLASDIGAASSAAANLVFNGSTLRYTGGGASIDRLFTVGFGGGTLFNEGSGPLTLNNSGTIPLAGTLTLNGSTTDTDTLASALINSGGLNKSGTGTWVLTGTNSYGGGTVVAGGVLQVGANGATGSLGGGNVSIGTGTAIDFQRTGTLTLPGAISGNGAVTQNGSGTVILANNNPYSGGTTINAGTLQLGNGGATGSLNPIVPIVNNSLLVFNTSGSFTYSGTGLISGLGNVIVQGGGFIKAVGNNTYTGWTRIDSGTTFQPRQGQDGFLVSSAVTNNGTLRLSSQDDLFTYGGPIVGSGKVQIGANAQVTGLITFTGTNAYTGGTFIEGTQLVLGDGSTPGAGALAGNVQFVNSSIALDEQRILTFNRPDDFTFGGTITTNFATPQIYLGIVRQNGTGTLTLTGNNTYGGGTVVNSGALVIGNGGASGSVGFGPVTLNSGNPLVINRSGSLTIWGNISGPADVIVKGGGTVTLNGLHHTYTGNTVVSNGTLIVNGTNTTAATHVYAGGLGGTGEFTGPVTMEPGTTLIPGASIGTLYCDSDLTMGGNLTIEVDRSVSPSNDLVVVAGVLSNAAPGILTVKNLGSTPLKAGDTFTLFSKPLLNGSAITVTGGRATWVNHLASDGSISVAAVIPPPALTWGITGRNAVVFSWSDSYNTFKLQAQTNNLGVGLSTNWADYPGGSVGPVQVPIDSSNGATFFRLVSTP